MIRGHFLGVRETDFNSKLAQVCGARFESLELCEEEDDDGEYKKLYKNIWNSLVQLQRVMQYAWLCGSQECVSKFGRLYKTWAGNQMKSAQNR